MLERFFKDRRTHNALLAVLFLASITIPFPTPLAEANEIPVEPTKPFVEKTEDPIKIEVPEIEKPVKKETLEEIISKVYKIQVEELKIKTQAILRTETNGIEDTANPMQVKLATGAESLKDFEKKIGTEKFKEITSNMDVSQKGIFEGQITFARYHQNAQIAFEKFPQKTIDDLALVSYNRGPGITKRIVGYWLANNPGTDCKVSWENILEYLKANSEKIDTALKLPPGKTREFTILGDTYVWRANLLSDPTVEREKAFPKK